MANLLRLSLFGLLPGGEEWSVNPVYGIIGASRTITSAEANAIALAVRSVPANADMLSMVPAGVTFAGARVEARTYAGVLEVQAEALKTTSQPGAASVIHPFQTAWALSLRTDQVGASGRGRLYWPAMGVTLQASTFRPTSVVVSATAAGLVSYLAAVEDAIETVIDPPTIALGVWSRKNAAVYPVTECRLGDVLDTQRRRRDQLVETYSQVTYPVT